MAMIRTKTLYSAVLKTEKIDDAHKFQSLPQPSGSYPYRLSVGDPINKGKLVFHMVGDTGGLNRPGTQQGVAGQMTAQHLNTAAGKRSPVIFIPSG